VPLAEELEETVAVAGASASFQVARRSSARSVWMALGSCRDGLVVGQIGLAGLAAPLAWVAPWSSEETGTSR